METEWTCVNCDLIFSDPHESQEGVKVLSIRRGVALVMYKGLPHSLRKRRVRNSDPPPVIETQVETQVEIPSAPDEIGKEIVVTTGQSVEDGIYQGTVSYVNMPAIIVRFCEQERQLRWTSNPDPLFQAESNRLFDHRCQVSAGQSVALEIRDGCLMDIRFDSVPDAP